MVINDENIKYELQAGFYLKIKKRTLEMKKGDEFVDKEKGVKIKVT